MSRPIRSPRCGAPACCALVLAALAMAAPVTDAAAPGQDALVTLGEATAEISFPTPVRYAVLLQEPGNVRMLYARGNILFHSQDATRSWTVERVDAWALVLRQGPRGRVQALPAGRPIPGFPGLVFTGTVMLDQLHYRYKVVERIAHPDPVLVALEGARALLEVEVVRRASDPSQAPPSPAPPSALPFEGLTPPASQASTAARATLDGELLDKVRVKEVEPGLYEVNAADVQAVLDNAGRVLGDLAPIVQPTLSLQTGLQYRITSAAGDGLLTGKGFTLTAAKLAERAGLQVGDTILSVNGRPVDGFASLYGIFREVRRDPALSTVQVELDRRGTRLAKTYRIR